MNRTLAFTFAALVTAGSAFALMGGERLSPGDIICPQAGPAKCFRTTADATSSTIAGQARAIDGDTIAVGASRVRLWGVDAPEAAQTCSDTQRRSYACGEASAAAMRQMLDRDPNVTCQVRDTDRYKRLVAVCRNGAGDLGGRLVALGWAIDYEHYSHGAYRDQQAAAKAERIGLWQGEFIQPEQWRREHHR